MEEMTMNRTARTALCVATIVATFVSFVTPLAALTSGDSRDRILFRRTATTLLAERADSPEKREKGLMYRSSLAEDEGMIFYFEQSGRQTFWMRNTLIPLTIIFVNEDLTIVDIQDMTPCVGQNAELCRTYTSRNVAKYAIEVNQGYTARHRIAVGDRVTIKGGK